MNPVFLVNMSKMRHSLVELQPNTPFSLVTLPEMPERKNIFLVKLLDYLCNVSTNHIVTVVTLYYINLLHGYSTVVNSLGGKLTTQLNIKRAKRSLCIQRTAANRPNRPKSNQYTQYY